MKVIKDGFIIPVEDFAGSDQMGFDFTSFVDTVGDSLATTAQSSLESESQKFIDQNLQKLLGTDAKAEVSSNGTVTIIKETAVPTAQTVVQAEPMSTNMKIGLGVGGVVLFGMFALLFAKTMKSN